MKKSAYIQKAKETILNRVRFHAPIVFDDHIDEEALAARGVDIKFPVFKFEQPLSKHLLKAFLLAKQEENFNLLISSNSIDDAQRKKIQRLKNCVIYDKKLASLSFVESVNKLNINYPSSSNYNFVFKDKFFKVNGQILNPHFDDFCLVQKCLVDDVAVEYCEFVLNGGNFFLKLENNSKDLKKVCLELNIPLKKGYYFFKRLKKSIMIENLLTKEIAHLNFFCHNAKFVFSNVDGLENSVFSCINIKVVKTLHEKEAGELFFNFGESCFSFKGKREIEFFKNLAWKKSCEIFNVRVKTKNPKFDQFFNFSLPQKIWVNWLNGEREETLENKYVTLKRLFVKGTKKMAMVNFKEIGLREIGIFNGEYFKKIFVVNGNERFLKVGKTTFHNINGITDITLKSSEPLWLCFGE